MSHVKFQDRIVSARQAAWLLGILAMALLIVPKVALAEKAAKPKTDEFVEVTAEGEGLNEKEATKDALRKALEQGGKMEIFSNSKVENYQLMYDTIISRAEGIVTDYKLVGKPRKIMGGTVKVKIKARVSKSVLKESWGAVQNVLNQIGRPKIMVYIVERIDGKTEEQSILETEIEKKLLKSGFDLVARTAVEATKKKEMEDAAANNNVAKMQAIAKDNDAHIFISGTANANQAGMENLYGTPATAYNCDVQLKAFYTDSAKILASAGIPNTRGLARSRKEFSPQAGKMALSFAGKNVVEEMYAQVMSQWATQISAGGELILEVQGMSFKGSKQLNDALAKMKGINNVNRKFSKRIATYRINATLSAEELADRLSEGEFESMLEIEDLKLNKIQAKAVSN